METPRKVAAATDLPIEALIHLPPWFRHFGEPKHSRRNFSGYRCNFSGHRCTFSGHGCNSRGRRADSRGRRADSRRTLADSRPTLQNSPPVLHNSPRPLADSGPQLARSRPVLQASSRVETSDFAPIAQPQSQEDKSFLTNCGATRHVYALYRPRDQ